MNTRHIEITVYGDDVDDDQVHLRNVSATVSEDGVPTEHVPMALVRATTAACVQLGLDSPTYLFRAAGEGVARLRDGRHEEILGEVRNVLTARGYGGFVSADGIAYILDELGKKARVGAALGPEFATALKAARSAYSLGSLAGRDLDSHPGQVAMLLRTAQALGALLREMIAIEPEAVHNDDGPMAEAASIGEDVEITAGRGEPS